MQKLITQEVDIVAELDIYDFTEAIRESETSEKLNALAAILNCISKDEILSLTREQSDIVVGFLERKIVEIRTCFETLEEIALTSEQPTNKPSKINTHGI